MRPWSRVSGRMSPSISPASPFPLRKPSSAFPSSWAISCARACFARKNCLPQPGPTSCISSRILEELTLTSTKKRSTQTLAGIYLMRLLWTNVCSSDRNAETSICRLAQGIHNSVDSKTINKIWGTSVFIALNLSGKMTSRDVKRP